MGRGMCKNLVEKGELTDPLILFNRTTSRAETLADQLGRSKTTVASTIQELVSASDIIFTCVGDDNSIRETIQTALEVDVSGKVFVDCSTVHPETTNALAADISSKNAEFAACPGRKFCYAGSWKYCH
jgi:3-hydroxyisobutyrate dehydrogenase-like beta-hydroxyacid dehydrogenase